LIITAEASSRSAASSASRRSSVKMLASCADRIQKFNDRSTARRVSGQNFVLELGCLRVGEEFCTVLRAFLVRKHSRDMRKEWLARTQEILAGETRFVHVKG
jgi:hypothetical protein